MMKITVQVGIEVHFQTPTSHSRVKFAFRLNSEFHIAAHPIAIVLILNKGHHHKHFL